MPTQVLTTGIDLYFETHGEGEPIILIPGTGFSGNVWDVHQVPELSKRFRIITLDPRGCGRSSKPGGVYTIDQMASDVAALMDELGLPSAHIVGHSMGGRIGLSLALTSPKRVRSLVMAASGSGPAARPGADCVPGLPFFLVSELVERGFEAFIRHEIFDTDTYFTDEYREHYPDKVAAFYDMIWSRHAHLHEFLRLCMARHMWEATHRLSEVRVPTLVVVGDADKIGSSHVAQAEALAKRIPGAEYLVLKQQSHGFFWQTPAESNQWVSDWVDRHRGG